MDKHKKNHEKEPCGILHGARAMQKVHGDIFINTELGYPAWFPNRSLNQLLQAVDNFSTNSKHPVFNQILKSDEEGSNYYLTYIDSKTKVFLARSKSSR